MRLAPDNRLIKRDLAIFYILTIVSIPKRYNN